VRSLYGFRGLRVQEITLHGRMRLIVVRARVDERLARAAIAPGVRDGSMSSDWTAWEKKAEVCVAVPVGEPLLDGSLYAFLPMGAQASCPVPAFVHALFFVGLSRRSFNEANPWNDLLLSTAARVRQSGPACRRGPGRCPRGRARRARRGVGQAACGSPGGTRGVGGRRAGIAAPSRARPGRGGGYRCGSGESAGGGSCSFPRWLASSVPPARRSRRHA
jgi:hypothetical protein